MLDIIPKTYNWILPRICQFCTFSSNNPSLDLCAQCKINLPWVKQRCCVCGVFLKLEFEAIVCLICRDRQPEFDCLYAIFDYAPPLIKMINRLKFSKALSLAPLFGSLLAEAVKKNWYIDKQLPEAIIPVPLHLQRLRHRGYNQALEICKPAAKLLQLPICHDKCLRIKNTKQQTRLDKTKRILNLENAFVVTKNISYKHVAIVDDVVTTGSTVRALSIELRSAGVNSIDIWCICRV